MNRLDTSREAVERLAESCGADVAGVLRALLAERDEALAERDAARLLVGTPGALTVNCIRGRVRCTERERLEAKLRASHLDALAANDSPLLDP